MFGLRQEILVMISFLISAMVTGCGTDDDGNSCEGDACNTDTGSDTTQDSMEDTGSDTGEGLPPLDNFETDQYANPEAGCDPQPEEMMLTAEISEDGGAWVAQCANRFGVQGAWFSYNDRSDGGNSEITMDYSQAVNGKVCATGVGGQVWYQDFAKYWGAGFGVNLCTMGDEENRVVGTLGACTLFDPRTHIIGFRITVEGDDIPAGPGGADPQLRVQFSEEGRKESAYIIVSGPGTADYFFDDALVHYKVNEGDTDVEGTHVELINALQFQISTVPEVDTTFSVCVSNIIPILG